MFTDAAAVREYVLAGKSVVTLNSARTGKHFSYRVRQRNAGSYAYFVNSLRPDGTSDRYLGMLTHNGFTPTANSEAGWNEPVVAAFRFFADRVIARGEMPEDLQIHHAGKCGRCGRALTDPASIERGIGPDCRQQLREAA